MRKNFYITTTLPYVNAKPHIGHALEFVQADVMARYQKLLGKEVFFNTGTDEHGLKVLKKAQELGIEPKAYADEQVENFKKLKTLLSLNYTKFIRTTDPDHEQAAQEFWRRCKKNGFIYKKNYKIKYCVGCELEKTESELEHGQCPIHPTLEIEYIEEENYFFRFSKFQKKLLNLYKRNPGFVKPEKRYNEIISFAERGLEDFSISRLKEKMPWGIEVPDDPGHVMYVWFDALVNYVSTLGWPKDEETFEKFWPGVQFCGKDNLRQQSAMWQAMLMSVDLPNSLCIYVNGFITVGGQKMSKSLGNVIGPEEMVERYGVDATRYLLLSSGTFGEDGDVTWERLDKKYNADLANGIGNLVSRVVTLYQKVEYAFDFEKSKREPFRNNQELEKLINEGRFDLELESIVTMTRKLDKQIEKEKPWELAKNDPEAFRESIEGLARGVYFVGLKLAPFMTKTSAEIKKALEKKEKITLFPRI